MKKPGKHVGLKCPSKILLGDLDEVLLHKLQTRVVNENVEPSKRLDRLFHDLLACVLLAHIPFDWEALLPFFLH